MPAFLLILVKSNRLKNKVLIKLAIWVVCGVIDLMFLTTLHLIKHLYPNNSKIFMLSRL